MEDIGINDIIIVIKKLYQKLDSNMLRNKIKHYILSFAFTNNLYK